MPTMVLRVNNDFGLHAYPSALLADAMQKCDADILIEYNRQKADAKKFLEVMGLNIGTGASITVSASGQDAEIALDTFRRIAESNFEPTNNDFREVFMEKLENIAMGIIANSGAARSTAFEALAKAKGKNYQEADELLKSSGEYALQAHKAHSELLSMHAKGEIPNIDILITHAQDHLMCAELAAELIAEIIELRNMIEER